LIAEDISRVGWLRCDVRHMAMMNSERLNHRSEEPRGTDLSEFRMHQRAPARFIGQDVMRITLYRKHVSYRYVTASSMKNVPSKHLGRRSPDAPQPQTRVGGWVGGAAIFQNSRSCAMDTPSDLPTSRKALSRQQAPIARRYLLRNVVPGAGFLLVRVRGKCEMRVLALSNGEASHRRSEQCLHDVNRGLPRAFTIREREASDRAEQLP
jgi:hypothetical protein